MTRFRYALLALAIVICIQNWLILAYVLTR